MMGKQYDKQTQLFYPGFSLEKRIPSDHILRKICEQIEFNFAYDEVKEKYGTNGNVSVPPPIILKIMLLLILYNVRSERELMRSIALRLDWMWFLGYDLGDEIPNHSILSKARKRWGVKVFKKLFERIVYQCVKAGLVDGEKLFMDSSLISANASDNSVINKDFLDKHFLELESRLSGTGCYSIKEQNKKEESKDNRKDDVKPEKKEGGVVGVNQKYVSTTDSEASIVRHGKGSAHLEYQVHRGVDGRSEVITTTEVTPGSINEAHVLDQLIYTHERNTLTKVATVVADKKYGTIENYLYCYDKSIATHIKPLEKTQKDRGRRKDIFSKDQFSYNKDTDSYTCPAGNHLTCRKFKKGRNHFEYRAAKKVCVKCQLKTQCTHDKIGRTLKRHIRQEELEIMYNKAYSQQSLSDLKTRQHLMERSFAQSVRYGFKKSRWRGLWRVQIQEYLTSSIQNIMILINNKPYRILARRKRDEYIHFSEIKGGLEGIFQYFHCLIHYLFSITHFISNYFMRIEFQPCKLGF